jgi:hypothetical protein
VVAADIVHTRYTLAAALAALLQASGLSHSLHSPAGGAPDVCVYGPSLPLLQALCESDWTVRGAGPETSVFAPELAPAYPRLRIKVLRRGADGSLSAVPACADGWRSLHAGAREDRYAVAVLLPADDGDEDLAAVAGARAETMTVGDRAYLVLGTSEVVPELQGMLVHAMGTLKMV